MAYAMTKQGSLDNCVTYEFICDTVADMNAIENRYRTIGTVAIVLQGNSGFEVYIADSNKQWNTLSSIGGSSGGSSEGTILPGGEGGGIASSNNDVIFYDDLMNDCQGGIAYSYSAAEFAELTEMPANPNHSNFSTHGISIPMTSQGWNYSLSDAKAYVAKYGKLNIGQMYTPTDGKSHWICYVPEDAPVERWNTKIFITVSGGSVNWQVDDETVNTASGSIFVTFPSVGWHDVKISAPSGVTYYPYDGLEEMYQSFGEIQKIIQIFLGDKVTKIDYYAFYGYSGLTSITIPNGVTSMDHGAFDSCYNLKFITIPNGVTSVSEYTFNYCYNLKFITIPNDVTGIGEYAFYECYNLISITIPDSVTYIDEGAFMECYNLTSITIPDSVTYIGKEVFYTCYNLTSITIPNSVTSIGDAVFYSCHSLTSITIPNNETYIGNNMFYDCSDLISITIPDSVAHIEDSAFYSCCSLISITIPNSIIDIGNNAFYNCYNLKNIIIEKTTPPTLASSSAFTDLMPDCTIIVPAGSRESYIAATNWSLLADHIVEATA